MELRGKRVLVTGATGGLGRAIAAALADRGAQLVLSSRKAEELDALSAALPGEHRVCVADLAEPGAGLRLLDETGALDGMVANAGLPGSGPLEDFSPEEVTRALRVNLEAPMLMAQRLVPGMVERGDGHLVFISSLAGRAATPRASVYSATKFGLRGFALGLREDLRGTGVGASVVMPGFVRAAGMFADSGASAPAGVGTATPEAVARAVIRAIEQNRGEIDVAPWRQVALAKFAGRHPELSGRISNSAVTKAADEVARGQTEKR